MRRTHFSGFVSFGTFCKKLGRAYAVLGSASMKLLIISLAGIGDTLMATPLLHELRANFPDAIIDVFVMWPGSRDLLEGNPHINSILQKNLIKGGKIEAWKFLANLRRQDYDISINTYPQSKTEYRLVARFIGARRRLSHLYDRFSSLDRWLCTDCIEQDYGLHASDNNLNLLKPLGVLPRLPAHQYELFLSPAEREWAKAFVGHDSRKILGVHVGSGTTKNLPLRRWPLESWIALLQWLLDARLGTRVFLFGGPEEQDDHRVILERIRSEALNVPPTKNLRQAAALLEKCHAFLSVDTALMHLAAAVKVPHQIVIETPTFNKTVEPYGRPFVMVPNPMVAGRNLEYYRYDGRGIRGTAEHLAACMRSVTVDAVLHPLIKAF